MKRGLTKMIRYTKPSRVRIHKDADDIEDLRVRNVIRDYSAGEDYGIGLLGVPFDYGVELSRGRAGTKEGPSAIRAMLKRYGTAYNIEHNTDISGLKACDFGDVVVAERDSDETHARVSSVVEEIIKKGIVPIVLGGGHDISFANVRGLCKCTRGKVGGINIDAHFDVRKTVNGRISSGTAFRRVLDGLDGKVPGRNFVEMGAHDNLNAKAHHEYLADKKASIITLDMICAGGMEKAMEAAMRAAGSGTSACFMSVDIDAMPQSVAPGCSAPSARGISVQDILHACSMAGAEGGMGLFDIMELNPKYDVDWRTALLAATMVVGFMGGFAARKRRGL